MSNPRKPTNMKLIEGTFRKDRANPSEPKLELSVPSCPSQISPKAKTVWKRIVPLLKDAKVIADVNRDALACYCEFVCQFHELCGDMRENEKLRDELDKEEKHYFNNLLALKKDRRSTRRELIQVGDSIRKYANEFGITPASQGKVSAIPDEPKKSPKGKEKSRFFD